MGKAIVVQGLSQSVVTLLTPAMPEKIASIHLPLGDWIVFGKVVFLNKYFQPLNADLTLKATGPGGTMLIDETDGLLAMTNGGAFGETMLSVMGPAAAGKDPVIVTMFAQVPIAAFVQAIQMSLLAIQVDSIQPG